MYVLCIKKTHLIQFSSANSFETYPIHGRDIQIYVQTDRQIEENVL